MSRDDFDDNDEDQFVTTRMEPLYLDRLKRLLRMLENFRPVKRTKKRTVFLYEGEGQKILFSLARWTEYRGYDALPVDLFPKGCGTACCIIGTAAHLKEFQEGDKGLQRPYFGGVMYDATEEEAKKTGIPEGHFAFDRRTPDGRVPLSGFYAAAAYLGLSRLDSDRLFDPYSYGDTYHPTDIERPKIRLATLIRKVERAAVPTP